MKNTMRCLEAMRSIAIIALVAVIGFSFAACGDGSGNGGGGGGGGGGSGLTITGLPSGQWNVLVFAAGTDISNYDAFDIISSIGSNKIEAANYGGNSGNFFPLVKVKVGGPTGPEDIWTGSGSRSVALNKGSTADYYWATVNFSNGNGTVQYSSFKPLGSGGEDPGTGDNPGTGGSGTEADPIALTAGTWADGNITSSASVVWYSFNVTSGQTYYVWWNDYYHGDDTKTADVEVSAYYSNGTSIFTNEDDGWDDPQSFTANTSGTVKIKVTPYSSIYHDTGTFAIVYSTSSTRPGSSGGNPNPNPGTGSGTEANPIALTAGTWVDGSVPSGSSAVWYSFSVTSGNTYYVWWNDGYGSDGTKTLDVKVSAYYSSGTSIFTSVDSGWSTPQSFTASSSGTVKIKVEPYFSSGTGTFAIVYSTSSTRPGASGDTGNPTNWIAVTDSPFGTNTNGTSSINDIAYGNGRFVAVGNSGKAAYSDDGISWTGVSVGNAFFSYINGIAYGNGKFVAVGQSGRTAYSTDGITWTEVSVSNFSYEIYAIAFGDGKFIVGGHSSKMATSSDGITWTAVEVSDIFGGSLNDRISVIAYGNGRFVAEGHTYDYIHKMATSTDGISWTAVTNLPFSGTGFIEDIAYGNGKFVAGCNSGLAYSTDGVSWTAAVSGSFGGMTISGGIAFGNNRFVAVGRDGKMAYSSDGVTWTSGPNISVSYNAVAYGNGRFVAVGSEGKMAYCDW